MSSEEKNKKPNPTEVHISGYNDEEWQRIGTKIVSLIERLSDNILEKSGVDEEQKSNLSSDITSIATKWAQAKMEKPSLENDVLKADILKKLSEARKIDMESELIATEQRNKEALGMIEVMERLIDLQIKMRESGVSIELQPPPKEKDILDKDGTKKLPNNGG